MSTLAKIGCAALLATVVGGMTVTHSFAATDPGDGQKHCFYFSEWQGWKSPDPNVLYLRVNLHDVYRVDLSAGSPELRFPDAHLISKVHGPNTVCSALDLDLAVSTGDGFAEPLIASSITKLTPEQVAAIPPKFQP